MGGTDNLKTPIGDHWQQGPINASIALNSSLNVAQFRDGRAADRKAQAGGPIANPGEMAFTQTLAVDLLKSIPVYVKEFKLVFDRDEIDIDMITDAIAEFEKTLVTPKSPFDQWLLGDKDALSADAMAGCKLFKDSGCTACHNGAAAGGNTFQKMGIVGPYRSTSPAEGLVAVTGKDADRFKFKVPTLRNVEMTYPYSIGACLASGHCFSIHTASGALPSLTGRRQNQGQGAFISHLQTFRGTAGEYLHRKV